MIFFLKKITGTCGRHLYMHISRLMQSENGILLLFYIFLNHRNGKKMKKGRVGCKKGGCCDSRRHLIIIIIIISMSI
jgi:hypothetical protein